MAATEAPSLRTRKREANRARLLDAARRVMLRAGYDRATIAEISAEADLGFGTFYSHFDSKEAIFQALVEESRRERGQRVGELLIGIDDPAEKIAVGAAFLVALANGERELTRFLLDVRRRSENPGDEVATAEVLALVADGCARGRMRVPDADAAGAAVSGMVLALMLALLRDQISPAAAVRSAAELSLRLLGVPEPECLELAAKAIEQVGAVPQG